MIHISYVVSVKEISSVFFCDDERGAIEGLNKGQSQKERGLYYVVQTWWIEVEWKCHQRATFSMNMSK